MPNSTLADETIDYLLALRLPGIGPVTLRRWLSIFDNLKNLFAATHDQLIQAGLTTHQIFHLKNLDLSSAERDLNWCLKNNCQIITDNHPGYPPLLKEIPDSPILLFVKGDPEVLLQPQLAIVGSRNPSRTGQESSGQFAYQLTKAGLTITSGLALGIDAFGHAGALRADGKTIAVLGQGLKQIYPSTHTQLAEKIISNGALISEFLPDEPAKAKNFPRRNRIISGLSLGVLVVEAALRSGSLITARFAAEQGREVFAMPGSIHNPLARGCHYLIHQGAKLVETAQDILEELVAFHPAGLPNYDTILPNKAGQLDNKTQKLLGMLGYEETPLDVIILQSGLTTGEVSSMLLTLELQGFLYRAPGGYRRVM